MLAYELWAGHRSEIIRAEEPNQKTIEYVSSTYTDTLRCMICIVSVLFFLVLFFISRYSFNHCTTIAILRSGD